MQTQIQHQRSELNPGHWSRGSSSISSTTVRRRLFSTVHWVKFPAQLLSGDPEGIVLSGHDVKVSREMGRNICTAALIMAVSIVFGCIMISMGQE